MAQVGVHSVDLFWVVSTEIFSEWYFCPVWAPIPIRVIWARLIQLGHQKKKGASKMHNIERSYSVRKPGKKNWSQNLHSTGNCYYGIRTSNPECCVCCRSQYQEAVMQGFSPEEYLDANDSYTYFSQLSSGEYLLKPGHTGTNVMDLQILCIIPE